MKKALKLLLTAVLIVAVLFAAAAFVFLKYYYFPEFDGELALDGPAARIEIYRDEYGIPHIIAGSERDAFFGLGFVMAQDRPFQLEIFRRASNGLLSEVLPGEDMRQMDRFSRFIRFRELGQRLYDNMDDDSRSYVEAFVKGVNEGYATLDGPLPRPLTLATFGGKAGDWKVEDPLAFGLMVSWMKAANYRNEYFFTKLDKSLGRELATELLPYYPPPDDDYVGLPGDIPVLAAGAALGDFLGIGTGCSAWAVNRDKTVSGESALVYNAHTGIGRVPAEHYLVHMKGGKLDMAGAAIVGVPGFFSGSNRYITWALTQNESDCSDLYREKINPENPGQYLDNGEWKDFEVREEEICYKDPKTGRTCETFEVRSTVRGPVISDMMDDYDKEDEVLSIQWTGFQPDISFNGYAQLALAENWDEFRAALDQLDINANHFLFADSEGHIGYQLAGMMPLRSDDPPPMRPVEGWNHHDIWPRRLSVDEMPHRFDPPEGMMASANNMPFIGNDPLYIGTDFSPPQRRDRLYEIMSSKDKFTSQELMDSQKDTFNITARQLLPTILADLGTSGEKDHEWLKSELENWDMKMDLDSRGALLFETLFVFMARDTFTDELGEQLAAQYLGKSYFFKARFFLMLEDAGNHWFDDTSTGTTETRRDITLRAAGKTIDFLEENIGPERAEWKWAKLHTLTIPHYADAVTDLLNIECGPVPGSAQTVNRFGFTINDPFSVSTIPDLRLFVDFADPDNVYAVVHTGQSGWWGHRNYDDQAMKLVNADLIRITLDEKEIKEQAKNRLTLLPLE